MYNVIFYVKLYFITELESIFYYILLNLPVLNFICVTAYVRPTLTYETMVKN